MRLLLLDNYDSFTYNLLHYIEKNNDVKVTVARNDAISLSDIASFDKIVLSPGPGLPSQAGIMPQLIEQYAGKIDILGICLGHQAIAEAFGAKLINLEKVYHGVATPIHIMTNDVMFNNIPNKINVGRYHSWCVETPLPVDFICTAVDQNNQIMAFKHQHYALRGVQFHPESILTEYGQQMIDNWLNV